VDLLHAFLPHLYLEADRLEIGAKDLEYAVACKVTPPML
jgi:hypothetical protein